MPLAPGARAFEVATVVVLLPGAVFPDPQGSARMCFGVWASPGTVTAFIIGSIFCGWLVDRGIGWRSTFDVILLCARGGSGSLTLHVSCRTVLIRKAEGSICLVKALGDLLSGAGFAFAEIDGLRWGWVTFAGDPDDRWRLAVAALGAVRPGSRRIDAGAAAPARCFCAVFVFAAALGLRCAPTIFGMHALSFLMPLYFDIRAWRGLSFVVGLELLLMLACLCRGVPVHRPSEDSLRSARRPDRRHGLAWARRVGVGLHRRGHCRSPSSNSLLVVGIGLGLNTAPVNGVAVAALPPERSGTASGLVNTSRMVGATWASPSSAHLRRFRRSEPRPAPRFLAGPASGA